MIHETATADLQVQSRLNGVLTVTLYALGIGAGAVMGLMGLLLAA
jgi:hypothetical protein